MAADSFPFSLGLPRWQPCQIPNPRATLNVKTPSQGNALSVNFPWIAPSPLPPPRGLTLISALFYRWGHLLTASSTRRSPPLFLQNTQIILESTEKPTSKRFSFAFFTIHYTNIKIIYIHTRDSFVAHDLY